MRASTVGTVRPAGGAAIAEVDSKLARTIKDVLIGSPVARTLGIELVALARDWVALGLPFSAGNVTLGDTVHGGVIAALIDIAGVAAAASRADPERLQGGATATLAVSFLAPARNVSLHAEASVVRRGARQVVADVAVLTSDANGTLVAKALVTVALF